MTELFDKNPIIFDLPDAEIIYYPNFFDIQDADSLFKTLSETIKWQQDDIKVFNKVYAQPRLTAFYSNSALPYSYSNIKMTPHPFSADLLKLKYFIETETNTNYNSVLLNFYRDGKDSNGWHADNEKELGTNPVIASLSFGAARNFQLKHNTKTDLKQNIMLEHGSLLLMKGSTQHHWKHQIPKTLKPIKGRINLTFRTVY